MQLRLINNVNEGQVEKMEPIILMLNNYVGLLQLESLEVIDHLFLPIFEKISAIPVPTENTSEIQKIQIKVVNEFLRLMNRVCTDYTPALFVQAKNLPSFNQFILLIFDHLDRGFDPTAKKIIVTLLRSLQINLNGIQHSLVSFVITGPQQHQVD